MSKVGICSYGVYIPQFRISTREIARVWGDDPLRVKDLYLIDEKSVEFVDEDAVTMAVESARHALMRANIRPTDIDAVYVGTESKPYAVKPISSIVIDALGLRRDVYCVDMEFACKAASEGLVSMIGLVSSKTIRYGLVIGTDSSQGEPGEHLDYSASSGAVALIVGSTNVVAYVEGTYVYSSDTPDFWRRDGSPYPVHGEGFTGEPAYFRHIICAADGLMKKLCLKPDDFDYAVFHQPNTRFVLKVASALKISADKVRPSIVVNRVGNMYNASALMGLANVLDVAKPGSRVLMVTYGSGASSVAVSLVVTDEIERIRGDGKYVSSIIERGLHIDYATYLRFRGLIRILM